MRKLVAVIFAIGALGITFAPIASADPECSPGQHGNPHGGFKPGVCK